MESKNPVLKNAESLYASLEIAPDPMRLSRTIWKSLFAVAVTTATAAVVWAGCAAESLLIGPALAAALLIVCTNIVLGWVVSSKPEIAPTVTPIFAGLEGIVLGAISYVINRSYPGIVLNALTLTLGTAGIMLIGYGTGVFRLGARAKSVVILAAAVIGVHHLVVFVLGCMGILIPYMHEASPLGIGVSLVCIVVAALYLLIDFEKIDVMARSKRAPKHMEWYGAFAILVGVAWLYVEMLRLLLKLRRR